MIFWLIFSLLNLFYCCLFLLLSCSFLKKQLDFRFPKVNGNYRYIGWVLMDFSREREKQIELKNDWKNKNDLSSDSTNHWTINDFRTDEFNLIFFWEDRSTCKTWIFLIFFLAKKHHHSRFFCTRAELVSMRIETKIVDDHYSLLNLRIDQLDLFVWIELPLKNTQIWLSKYLDFFSSQSTCDGGIQGYWTNGWKRNFFRGIYRDCLGISWIKIFLVLLSLLVGLDEGCFFFLFLC